MDVISQFVSLDLPVKIGTLAIVHLTHAIVCAIIAGHRHRDRKKRFFLALFFQVAALAWLLIAPAKSPPPSETE